MKKTNFNKKWKFWDEKDAFSLNWEIADIAKDVDLPYDAMIYSKAHPESPNMGNTGFRDGGVYQYAKMFTPTDPSHTYMLKFEGVYMNAMVYVNAQLAATCHYGYTEFYVELNNYLRFNQENEIRVIVRNSAMSNSRWYSGSGIYRDVYLLESGQSYICPDGCRIRTEELEDDMAVLTVENRFMHKGFGTRELEYKLSVLDENDNEVYADSLPVILYQGQESLINRRVFVPEPKKWSTEEPHLYTLHTSLVYKNGDSEEVVDTASNRFGIRKLSLDARRGFRINGQVVNLKGACIHHDNGILGANEFYDASYRRISKLKEAGFNAIRMSHHPASETLLCVCDELGMLVMDECFDMWSRCKTSADYAMNFQNDWEKDVEALVKKDYNHPSVILYSLGNEIPEIGLEGGSKLCQQISNKVKSMDSTRYTLAGINGIFSIGDIIPKVVSDIVGQPMEDKGGNVNDFMAAMFANMDKIVNHPEVNHRIDRACAYTDIAGYNYMDERYVKDGKNYPNRIIVGSETYPRAIPNNWKLVKEHPYVIGDFTWTGWDYLGEAGIGVPVYGGSGDGFGSAYPCQLSYTGDIDITGFRRPASYLKEIAYGDRVAPYICCQRPQYFGQTPNMTPWSLTDAIESWSFPGYEGKNIKVEVFSPGDEVELFVNGKSIGKQPAGEAVSYHAVFETVYEPGIIQAVSYLNGQELGFMEINTASEGSQIAAEVHPGKTGQLVYIDLWHKDDKGFVVTEDDIEVSASTENPDVELFIGSGNHSPLLEYTEGKTMTWNGHAQIILRKKNPAQNATITVSSKYGTFEI